MSHKLFLDDFRFPSHCLVYTNNPIYEEEWEIVRDYEEFCRHIEQNGIPETVSFDHDLADEHYSFAGEESYSLFKEKTGFDCAKWLVEYCNMKQQKLPKWLVHSMNPVGSENIKRYLEIAEKLENK